MGQRMLHIMKIAREKFALRNAAMCSQGNSNTHVKRGATNRHQQSGSE